MSADPDEDGDGIPDATDNCPIDSNPAQLDADAERVGKRRGRFERARN
jgi:hypothetical protein